MTVSYICGNKQADIFKYLPDIMADIADISTHFVFRMLEVEDLRLLGCYVV
jgi:hypothetical protein